MSEPAAPGGLDNRAIQTSDPAISTATGQKRKSKDSKSRSGREEGAPKKRRIATENAMAKIRDQQSASKLSDEDSSDTERSNRKIDTPKANATSSLTGKKTLIAPLLSGGGLGTVQKRKIDSTRGLKEGGSGSLRKRISRIGDKEWEKAESGEDRLVAVIKAIDRVYEMSLVEENFSYFGNDMIQCFYDVATVTGEPVRSKTLKYVEHLANRWKYTVMQEGWKGEDVPTPSEVIDVVIGMYCMERVGIRHDVKAEVLDFMSSPEAYTAADYLGGWDPRLAPPPLTGNIEVTSGEPISRYRAFSNSLIHAFYADRVGLNLGCTFSDIFQWLPTLRPYKAAHELDYQEYIDQCYMVTHIIFTTNNWGELSLHPSLFPHEYHFIKANFEIHLQQRDVHLIAEFMETLRCFGCKDDNELIRRGTAALLGLQQDNGIWDPSEEPYRTYHATMCGAQALLAHRYRGFGPGIPSVAPLLVSWAREDAAKNAEYKATAAKYRVESDARRAIFLNALTKACGMENEKHDSVDTAPATSGLPWPDGSMDNRINDLKLIMRSAAKRASAAEPNEHTTSAAKADPKPKEKAGDMEQAKDKEESTIAKELSNLSRALETYFSFGTSQKNIEKLEQLLIAARELPISAAALKSHPTIAKDIKAASKGRGGRAKITQAATEVMEIWKQALVSEFVGPTPSDPPIISANSSEILNVTALEGLSPFPVVKLSEPINEAGPGASDNLTLDMVNLHEGGVAHLDADPVHLPDGESVETVK